MDRIDRAILASLEQDGRQSFGAIADDVGLSKTPCWNRIQNLRETGVIRGYRAVLDHGALGLKLFAFCEVTIDFSRHADFEKAVMAHPAVIECFTTAGEADYLLQVVTSDVERLDGLLRDEIRRLPGVQRFSTLICLKRIKEGGPLTSAASLLPSRIV